jgi:propionyl-CoA synthetase
VGRSDRVIAFGMLPPVSAGRIRPARVLLLALSVSHLQGSASYLSIQFSRETGFDTGDKAMRYADFYRRSIEAPEAFWAEQAALIDWKTPPQQILDDSRPPFARWFVGGTTNLCHNAVDRHLAERGDQPALIAVSTETGTERSYSFRELHAEVQRVAASLAALGVGQGDRVLIYMPMIPEAAFAMLACARLGAIHCVVFGGFASGSLASRIEDATPKVVVSADAGSRGGKVIAYKPLLDEAIRLSKHKPGAVLLFDRGLAPMDLAEGRDHLAAPLLEQHRDAQVPCAWIAATDISYTIYTSGTTGRPKGVQRDVGGYAVALTAGRARRTSRPATSAGWWATATSSMGH